MRTRARLSAAIGCLLWPGCGSGTIGTNPCDSSDPDPMCGAECATDGDCGAALYCSSDLTCTADCTAGGAGCGAGMICGEHGRCVPEVEVPDASDGCPSVDVALSPTIPLVVLLIDQSGSMTDPFGGLTRWEAVRAALVDPDNGVVPLLQSRVVFGASLYTSNDGNNGGTCPILTTVAPIIDNYPAIRDLMNGNEPAQDTPTGESIVQVIDDIQAIPQDPARPVPRAIVLATDGLPDTCAVPNPQEGQPEAVAAAQAAWAAGISTYILSVGNEVGEPHLRDMANAGQGLPIGGAEQAPFYVGNDQAELVDKFNEIIRGVRTCTIELDGTVDLDQADQGQVTLNGQPLTYGVDWQMVDADTLELLGAACDMFLATDNVALAAEFPCGVIVP